MAEGRPLISMVKRRNVRKMYEALNLLASEANKSGNGYPDRVSPGGPDPHHHSRNN
ncbi:conserved hypothetical protein [Ricinus communis]|uniref:Uncharacterized protein n=1 Tax=Ricinus communis TaxID=3988 RepID=B9S970_RICCO|nr:conserved hypothetical protein [Ricinus communis]